MDQEIPQESERPWENQSIGMVVTGLLRHRKTAWISRRVGGDQIDYADEKPAIRTMFSEALAKHGMSPKMDDAYAKEIPDLPPPRVAAE